ncbi:MAG TPA: RsmD family RNA methyltransferase [Phycisphaerales bacterium]|nr:RsmD family RNA methyltransferase [Phycisphaerales bacterium]
MRIIAGEFRSRRLLTPPDDSITRPIPDRVKESLFGLLRGHCEGASVFDGFAGTGAIGLEALSRGASRCVFVEQDKSIGQLLSKNIETLGVKDRAELVIGDALGPGALARAPRPLTLAFLDPPYPLVQEAVGFKRTMAQVQKMVDLLTLDGFVVLRTPWPLKHKQGSPAPVAPPVTKKGKGRFDRRAWEREVLEPRSTPGRAAHGLTARDEALEELAEASPTVAKASWIDVDLHLPNAQGPETHVYHNMAVHLYMRKA